MTGLAPGILRAINSLAFPNDNFCFLEAFSGTFVRRFDNTPRGVYGRNTCKNMRTSKQALIQRLKIIEGQVRGLQEMVEKDTYCIDVITQTSAIKQGLTVIEDTMMESHLGGCVISQIKGGREDKAKAEILKVYRLKRK